MRVNDIRTVRNFSDVFSDELLGLPLDNEVELNIELYPGSLLVSFTPHRMTTKELKKLNIQLQKLLDRGFVRPSVSLWGSPILFVKKK